MISIRGLCVDFEGVKALDDVALDAPSGTVVGVVGPNGSGKTTLLDALCGLAAASGGTIEIDGRRIDGLAPHRVAAAGVARTHQAPRLFARMTALENVAAGAYLRAGSRASILTQARAALASFGYERRENVFARDLDENDRRRVEMARAAIAAPAAMLLDEPLTSFDDAERAALRARLRAHARENDAVVVVAERDVLSCAGVCDRAIVLHAGKKIADGTLEVLAVDPDVRDAYLGVEWRQ